VLRKQIVGLSVASLASAALVVGGASPAGASSSIDLIWGGHLRAQGMWASTGEVLKVRDVYSDGDRAYAQVRVNGGAARTCTVKDGAGSTWVSCNYSYAEGLPVIWRVCTYDASEGGPRICTPWVRDHT
jgi:hypothetical protein